MSARATRYLALFGGLAIIVAGLTVPQWLASPGIGVVQAAQILHDNRVLHWIYVIGVLLSAVSLAPVVILLAIRLYRRQPGPALLGAGAFVFGLVLEVLGALVSLARLGVGTNLPEAEFSGAVAAVMSADTTWLPLYLSLTSTYQLLELSGVILVFVGALALSAALWRRRWVPLAFTVPAIVLFVLALFVPGLWLTTVMAAAFAVLGGAYGAFGYATARLNHRVEIDPDTGAETVGQTPRSRRSRRSRRR